jgi:hypothetical protein
LLERRSAAGGSTLSHDASFFVGFHPVSGCHGSKMGAEIRAQSLDCRRGRVPCSSLEVLRAGAG